jgi:hypothetical protein
VYVGDSIPENIVDKYVTEAPKLADWFGGEKPKICGTHTFMRHPVAASRIQTMTQVFNFLFNESKRKFGNPSLQCKTSIATEQSIIMSKMFEYKESDITFAEETSTVTEKEGYIKMTMTRKKVGQTGIAFVQTELMTADRSDIVPFNGPVVFKSSEKNAFFFTQIKYDGLVESDEKFACLIKKITIAAANNGPGQNRNTQISTIALGVKQHVFFDMHRTKGRDSVRVITIPVGQGDSTLIECPPKFDSSGQMVNKGFMTLIDMGSTKEALTRADFVSHVMAYTEGGARQSHIIQIL